MSKVKKITVTYSVGRMSIVSCIEYEKSVSVEQSISDIKKLKITDKVVEADFGNEK